MIIRRATRPSFTVIDNRALDDERLSYKALGLLAYVLRQPDSWETNYRHLASKHADGETAVRSALKELEQHGYIERHRQQGEGGKFEWVQVIYEVPGLDGDHASVLHARETHTRESHERETAPVVSNEEASTDTASNEEQSGAALARLDEWQNDLPAVVYDSGLLEIARELCALLETTLTDRGYRTVIGKARSRRWQLDMEALLRLDERKPAQVRWVIGWLHRGEDRVSRFWRTNVRSPDKLRVQWDVMREQYAALEQQSKSRQQLDEEAHARSLGIDPDEARANTDQLVRDLFGPSDSGLTSDGVIDVESRGA